MKKIMCLWDIVFMNVTAVLGLRWLPIAAAYGAASILLWILAALLFFVPLGLVSTELATGWPDEGGMYVWVKTAFGEKCGFLVSWFYWVNSFFYCPALLTFAAVALAYLYDPSLAFNRYFVCTVILVSLWIVTWLNFTSMKLVKWLANIGGSIGTILPGLVIIFFGFAAVFIWKKPIATSYSLGHWLPNLSSGSNIAFLSTLMFSMAGIELTPTLAGETKDPQKTFPRATIISAILIVGTYILGTVAMTFVLPASHITASYGFMDAMASLSHELNMPVLLAIVAITLSVGQLGGASVWIVGPIKMLFESTKDGILPEYVTKLNKNEMPRNAIIIQSAIVTLITIGTLFVPSINIFYETLVLMATIIYFIPYLFMFATFLKLRYTHKDQIRPYKVPGGNFMAWVITVVGLIVVIASIFLPFLMPPADVKTTAEIWSYRVELIIGPLLFIASGYWLYWRYERRSNGNN